MAEAFNEHFTSVVQTFPYQLQKLSLSTNLSPTDKTFSLQTPSVDTYLDMIPVNGRWYCYIFTYHYI